MRWECNRRNMTYNDWRDRRDPNSDIGYVHDIHREFGLDVIMHIPDIDFKRVNFGTQAEIAANDWTTDIFTEIRLEGTYVTPYHYHITLVHTFDVGKGFNHDDDKMQEWVYHYNRLRRKYNNRHARLTLDRWGSGCTFYVKDAVVDGLPESDNMTGDLDLNFVFDVPGKHKAGDGLHVSLLI